MTALSEVGSTCTSRATSLSEIPCAAIDPSPDQNREVFDPVRLEELAGSIRESGLLQPVRCRVSAAGMFGAESAPRYVLVAGERRLRACRDLLGWETIPAVVDDGAGDPLGAAIGTLAENMVRHDPGPLEEAAGLVHALELGTTPGELAVKLGKSARWVRDRLALLQLAPDVAHYLAAGNLPIGRAVLMAELDVNRQRLALQAHEHGIGPDAFRALCGKLADEQAADSMISTDDFLRVDEYVVEAEAAVAPPAPVVVREIPLGMAEIGELLGVATATVSQWRARGVLREPDLRVGGSPAYWQSTIEAWARETGRL